MYTHTHARKTGKQREGHVRERRKKGKQGVMVGRGIKRSRWERAGEGEE